MVKDTIQKDAAIQLVSGKHPWERQAHLKCKAACMWLQYQYQYTQVRAPAPYICMHGSHACAIVQV